MEEFSEIDVREEMEIDEYEPAEDEQKYEETMWKSAEAFRKKKKHLYGDSMTCSKLFR